MSAPSIVRTGSKSSLMRSHASLLGASTAHQRVSQAAPGLADGGNWQRQQSKRRKPLGSGDVGAVAFKQQVTPSGDALMASARLFAVIVEMIEAVDRRA